MPELPEVETTVRGLRPLLEGRTIVEAEVRREGLRRPFPRDLAKQLAGARVTSLGRRAKYGLIETDRDQTMVFHLGMSGRWRVDPETVSAHDHLVLITDEGHRLALNDARRFGSVDLVETGALHDWPTVAALGPEPLGPDFNVAHLRSAFAARVAPIKALLLDQRVVAGLGNIYVCEALNRSGILPARPAGSVGPRQIGRLVVAIRDVLDAAIEAGGSTLRDYARPDGQLGYFARQWRVYGREGQPCPCGRGTVVRRTESGRSTFFCAKCQR